MANVRGKVVGDGNKPVIEKYVPSAGWTGDSNGHYLLIDLPEFKKEQLKIQIDPSTGDLMVRGERATNQIKHVRFEQTYKVPEENSDLNKITARFDGEILSITVPKQVVEKKSQNVEILYITIEKKNVEHEEGPLRIAMKTLSQNGVIIATALIAFQLGVLLSRRSQH